jgi:DNA-binding NarL/FixJ family response regulator
MRSDILLFSSGSSTELALRWAIGSRSIHLEMVRAVSEAIVCLERSSVDVLICDDEQSGGAWLDLLIHAARCHSSIVSIVTAYCPPAETVIRAINDGRVFAFLPKPLDRTELKHNVDEALNRSATSFAMRRALEVASQSPVPPYRPPVRAAAVGERATETVGFNHAFTGLPGDLSLREWEVLALLTDGLTTRQIAKHLCISIYTVRNHLKSMYRKLEVHSQSELIDWHQSAHPHVAAG